MPNVCNGRTRPPLVGTAALLSVCLAATACSSSEDGAKKDYAIPSSWCGYHIPAQTIEPLLPGGKRLTAKADNTQGRAQCNVYVDGKRVLFTIATRLADDSAYAAGTFLYGPTAKFSAAPSDDQYAVYRYAAVQLVPCPKERKDGQKIYASVYTRSSSAGEAALKKAVRAYAPEVAKTKICTEFDS
jgi:hypothetical protein